MRLTEQELNEMVEAMADLDFGPEIEIETENEDGDWDVDEYFFEEIDDNELYEDPVDYYGEDYSGYEDYEPNVYDGTYSEE